MKYYHVDVFTDEPLRGNGLTVVCADEPHEKDIDGNDMLRIAREFRQFETIFLSPVADGRVSARIFTVQEELDFAGHPLLGAAAVIHSREGTVPRKDVTIALRGRDVRLTSERKGPGFTVSMNQGIAREIRTLEKDARATIAPWFSVDPDDIDGAFPLSIVSTGLPYLLVPVRSRLSDVRIAVDDLEDRLSRLGAKFAYFFDTATLECRSWDNTGAFEDVATGSAAGPLISYLVMNGSVARNERVSLRQGGYLDRESRIEGFVNDAGEVVVSGSVAMVVRGDFEWK